MFDSLCGQNEDLLLKQLGLPGVERRQIEGVMTHAASSSQSRLAVTEDTLSTRALLRLAADPPPQVGDIQRRTTRWLLRPL